MSIQSKKRLFLRLSFLTIWSILLAAMFGFQLSGIAYANGGSILYAKPSGLASGTCDSWVNACTLQYALGLAVSGDEIWVSSGIHLPTSGTDRSISFVLKSGVGVYGGFNGTEIVRQDRNPSTNVTILSGDIGVNGNSTDNSYHVVTDSGTDSSAVLDGFTITKGNANFDSGSNTYGGGIFNVGGSPTLSNLVVTQNSSLYYGGGIYNVSGSPSLTDVIISNNTSVDLSNGYGGGMFNSTGNPTLTNVIFDGNTAVRGAGMYNTLNGNAILTNITFSNNVATFRGGGLSNSESSPMLTNVTFNDNQAQYGGGLHIVYGSSATLTNVTFSGNSASVVGGAIYLIDSNPVIEYVTISGNTAVTNGGGLYNEGSNPVITNSIVYGNSGTQIYNVTSTPVVTYSIVQGGYSGTGNSSADPLLGTLQDNGGTTKTLALLPGSAAIDAGSNLSCPITDQRGVTRPQGMYCDMGAFEAYDTIPPVLTSFTRQTPASSPTNSDTLVFRATFNEYVKDVDDSDFEVSGSTATVSGVNTVDARTYDITISGGDLAALNGVVGINLAGTQNIKDLADNALPLAEPSIDQTYLVDNTAPSVVSITRNNSNPTAAASVNFTVTFSEEVSGVNMSDFGLTSTGDVTGAAISSVTDTGDQTMYIVTVDTGNGDGTIRLDVVDDNSIIDMAGNPLGGAGVGDGNFTGGDVYTIVKTANIQVHIGGSEVPGSPYSVAPGQERREYYVVSGGPVVVESTNGVKIVSAIRLQSYADNSLYSFVETMGVPAGSLSSKYYFPTYNNTWGPLNSQLRFGNLNATDIKVKVTIGASSWIYDVAANSERREYLAVSGGPVIIESVDANGDPTSDKKIVAAIRLQSYVAGKLYSFAETMGIPADKLSNKYYFPTYNNTWGPLNSQLRFGNLNGTDIKVRVTIGTDSWTYDVAANTERREYLAVSGGPVIIESVDANGNPTPDKKIIAAIRLQSYANSTLYSFVETMGVPEGSLSSKYYFPTYNNTWGPLNSQLRFGNLNGTAIKVKVTIGTNSWIYDVAANSERREYLAVSGGPVIIESVDANGDPTPDKKIVAAIRLQSYVAGKLYSFAETMGIPVEQLTDTYYFPTYNNTWTPLNSQLRFGVP